MTLTALLLAVSGTAFLVGVAGWVLHGKKIVTVGRSAVLPRQDLETPWAVVSVGLALFGIVIGIPLGLGMIETSMLSLLAAPLCCMAATWLISGDPKQGLLEVAWFIVMAWCASIPFLIIGSFSANDPAAVQAVLGPLPLHQGPVRLSALAVGLVTGTFAASRWLSVSPTLVIPAGVIIRWGQAALAGTLIFATASGSGLASLAYGVMDPASLAWSATSLGASAFGVLSVTWLSQRMTKVSDRYLFPVTALLASAATVAAVLG